jgi:hypothetical protein
MKNSRQARATVIQLALFVIGFGMNATPGLHCISWGIASSTLRLSPQEMMKPNSTSRPSVQKTVLSAA